MGLRQVMFTSVLLLIGEMAYAHVDLENPLGGETYKPETIITIKWRETVDHGGNNWDLYFSPDNGITWEAIELDIEDSKDQHPWQLPKTLTDKALIKIIQDNSADSNYEAISGTFSIAKDPDDVVTSLGEKEAKTGNDMILKAYPNPFSEYVVLEYFISEKSIYEISLFSVYGQKVYQLHHGILDNGLYKYHWNNIGLPDGMYICRLSSTTQNIDRKIIIRR